MNTATTPILCLACCLAVPAILPAHGGQYRGPGEVIPQTGSNSSAKPAGSPGAGSGSRSGAGVGSGGGTARSGPTASRGAPGGVGAGAATPRGVQLGDDLTRWEFWWEFGKDPFLRLREAIYAGAGTMSDDFWLDPRRKNGRAEASPPIAKDRALVADRLVRLLQQEPCRDTMSACLVALAKIGRDGESWKLRDVLTPFLARPDQEVRETAALALGISGRLDQDVPAVLVALLADDATGRKLSGGRSVNERTRAFAAYGLGLLIRDVRDPALAHRLTSALVDLLEKPAAHGRELLVAAIEACSQFPRDWDGGAADSLRAGLVNTLETFYDLPLGAGDELVQAHVPTALGRMLRPGGALAKHWRDRFTAELTASLRVAGSSGPRKVNPHIFQSIAVALGALSGPWEPGDADVERTGEALLDAFAKHKDHQVRWFAVQALGRMGGTEARRALVRLLQSSGTRSLQQPWVAMALGVQQARLRAAARANRASFEPNAVVTEALRDSFEQARNPSVRAAMALSLGLAGDEADGDLLREALPSVAHQEDLAGYISIALGLMRDRFAVEDVRRLMRESLRRPRLIRHCAQALGLLGDHTVVETLCDELQSRKPSLVRLSAAASALGQIGDRRALAPLLAMLDRTDITPLTRAFAVVALGGVCDEAALPWNSAYAMDCNYRAATSTLTDGAAGILDIL